MARVQMFLGVDISDAEKKFKRLSRKMQKFGRQVGATGKTLTKTLTVPIVAMGTASLKAADNVDKANKLIAKGTGATGEALKALQGEWKSLAGEVSQSMGESAQVVADFNTRLGVTGPLLKKLSKSALDAGRMMDENVSQVVEQASKAMQDWNVESKDMALTMDKLFKASQDTGIGISKLGAALYKYGSPLRQMGFNMTQAIALMSSFDKAGVNMELVLGSLRIALGKMAKEGVEDTSTALQMIIEDIKTAGSVGEANAIALEKFGSRAGPDMAAAIREGRFEIDNLVTALNGASGSIDKTNKSTQTLGEQWKQTKNQIDSALAPMGKVMLDLANSKVPALQGKIETLADKISSMSSESINHLLKLAGALAVTGPLLMAVKVAIDVFTGLSSTMLLLFTGPAAPFVVGVAAVGALALAFKDLNNQAKLGFRSANKTLERGSFMKQAGEIFQQEEGRYPVTAPDFKRLDAIIDELIKNRAEAIAREGVDADAIGVVSPDTPAVSGTPKPPVIPTITTGGGAVSAPYIGMTTAESTAADIARIQSAKDVQLEAIESAQQGVSKFWSEMSWESSQGLITNQDYFNMLKTEVSGLTVNTDEWRTRFAELQAVAGEVATERLEGLSEALKAGKITTEEWKTKVDELKTELAGLPNAQKKLEGEISDTNSSIKELDTSTALWADNLSQGLADAIVNGESLGDVLSNIGKQLASSMLQKLILGGLTGGGGLGSLFGMHTGGVVGQDHSLVRHIPKMHNGGIVGADEQMTILQKGETVLPRGESEESGTTIININATDAQSFAKMMQSGKATIESIVAGSLMSNGTVRRAIKGAM